MVKRRSTLAVLRVGLLSTLSLLLTVGITYSKNDSHDGKHRSPYVNETDRQVKSLSEEDIRELERGGGWGLARAAELNGMPGPVHILEMKEQINLSTQQQIEIEKIYQQMKAAATDKGQMMIAMETELDQSFKHADIDEQKLTELVTKIARLRGELRLIHLSAHLKSLPVLTQDQVSLYNQLRGYSQVDPCLNVPSGHDETMWRKHNNCN